MATGSQKKNLNDCISSPRKPREQTGSGVRLWTPKPQWCNPSSNAIFSKSLISSSNSTTNSGKSFQIHISLWGMYFIKATTLSITQYWRISELCQPNLHLSALLWPWVMCVYSVFPHIKIQSNYGYIVMCNHKIIQYIKYTQFVLSLPKCNLNKYNRKLHFCSRQIIHY